MSISKGVQLLINCKHKAICSRDILYETVIIRQYISNIFITMLLFVVGIFALSCWFNYRPSLSELLTGNLVEIYTYMCGYFLYYIVLPTIILFLLISILPAIVDIFVIIKEIKIKSKLQTEYKELYGENAYNDLAVAIKAVKTKKKFAIVILNHSGQYLNILYKKIVAEEIAKLPCGVYAQYCEDKAFEDSIKKLDVILKLQASGV